MATGMKSLGSNIVTMNKAGGVQTVQGLQVPGTTLLGQCPVFCGSGSVMINFGSEFHELQFFVHIIA